MAGILDSDWVRFLATPRAYYANKRADEQAAKLQGLLGQNQQQGPTMPGQGLLGANPPSPQFWMQAATIPGYEQLAGQQLGIAAQGDQRLAEQQQQQQWASENMTAAQAAQLALQSQKASQDYGIAQQNLARQWYGTQASAGASNASADLSRAKLGAENRKTGLLGGSLYDRLKPNEQVEANNEILNADTWATSAADVADWADKRAPGAAIPLAGTGEAAAFNTEWQTSALPAFMQIMNTGVLQPGERETLAEVIGSPADKVLTKSQVNVIKTVAQKVKDLRGQTYKKYDLQPKPLESGQSAAARTLGATPVGEVRPVGDLDQTGQWQPVKRY